MFPFVLSMDAVIPPNWVYTVKSECTGCRSSKYSVQSGLAHSLTVTLSGAKAHPTQSELPNCTQAAWNVDRPLTRTGYRFAAPGDSAFVRMTIWGDVN